MELNDLHQLIKGHAGSCSSPTILILLSGYILFQVLDLVWELTFMELSEAALLKLSLLTADVWATLFSVFAVGMVPSGFYFISLVTIVVGIVIYEAAPSPLNHGTPSDINIKVAKRREVVSVDSTSMITNVKYESQVELS